jgi:alkaline phosphatase D
VCSSDLQEKWVVDTVTATDAVWNVLANQTVMTDIRLGDAILNFDQWDGYAPSRDRLLTSLRDKNVENLVVLTGDIHLAGIGQLTSSDDPSHVHGIEFVTTSISSRANAPEGSEGLFISLPNVVDAELAHRGYTLHTVTPDSWTANDRIVDNVLREDSAVSTWKSFQVQAGIPAVTEV